jgi:N-ethylmaleimide reductase
MSIEDVQEVIRQFAQAAKNAREAGFDGVEIHGAHGYLIDQFNSDLTNKRTDRYGGDLAQRLTFMKEVLAAVIDAIGADRTVIRFSLMKGGYSDKILANPEEAIRTFIDAFKEVGVKMIHPSTAMMNFTEVFADGKTLHQLVRKYWDGVSIGVGQLTPEIAEQAIQKGTIDIAAFGRPLIANPDFLHRIKKGEELVEYDVNKHLGTLV